MKGILCFLFVRPECLAGTFLTVYSWVFFLHYQRLNVEFYKLTVPQSVFDKAARAHSEVLMY